MISASILNSCTALPRNHGSSVDIATGCGLDDREVRVPVGLRFLSSPCRPGRLWDPHSLILNGFRGGGVLFSPGIKRSECEADHSPPTSAKVIRTCMYTYIHSRTRLHGVVLS
jgi:hypothetical protein